MTSSAPPTRPSTTTAMVLSGFAACLAAYEAYLVVHLIATGHYRQSGHNVAWWAGLLVAGGVANIALFICLDLLKRDYRRIAYVVWQLANVILAIVTVLGGLTAIFCFAGAIFSVQTVMTVLAFIALLTFIAFLGAML